VLIINFSHPLTPAQLDQIAGLTQQAVERVIDVPTHFPSVLQLRPVAASLPPRFEVAEILPLQETRLRARQTRTSGAD